MDFKPLIHWLQNQIKTGFFWSRIENPKDISDPIVKAIRDKEYETLDPLTVSEPIVSALEDTTRAIEAIQIPEVKIPEVDFSPVTSALKELLAKKDKDVVIKQGDVNVKIDTDKILKVLKRIEEKKPKEQIDYTPILSDIYDIIEGKKEVDLSKVEKFIADFKIPELPLEDGRVKVTIPDEELAKMRSKLFTSEHLRNTSNVQINPATSEKQDTLLIELQKKADLTETQPVSAASLPLPSGAATAANQGKWNGVTSGLSTWKEVDGKPRVSAMPYTYDIAEGNVTGHESWSKIGYNGDVDASTEDMIGQGGTYVFPAAQGSMDIVSSSAEDDILKAAGGAGSGIHTVTLYYLDNTFAEKSVDITLNGTLAVETSVSDIYRVQNMRAKVCGTGGSAAGNITLSEHGGTTYKYGYIALGQTRMRQCVYTVPKDKTLYITGISFAVGGATKEKCAVFTTMAKYDNKALATRDFFIPYNEVIIEDSAYHRELELPTKLPAGVDFKVQVRGLVADCVCTCSLRGWLETT